MSGIIESVGARIPGRYRAFVDPFTGHTFPISATAKTTRSLRTAIRADLGETEAYKEALRRGEIGLQRPLGINVRGVDFITAARRAGMFEIIVTDVKTSEKGKFPVPKQVIPGDWRAQARQAVNRLALKSTNLADQIRAAFKAGRIRRRQLNVHYSPAGMFITGW